MFLKRILFQQDVSIVLLALNVHQQSPNYVGSIIRDCVSFKGSFRSLNFLHVRREVNQAAHYLAKYALTNLDCIWIEETPPCISAILVFDKKKIIMSKSCAGEDSSNNLQFVKLRDSGIRLQNLSKTKLEITKNIIDP